MRFIIILSLFFLSFNVAQAQQFNNLSLEVGGGAHFPFNPKDSKDQTSLSNYISMKQFQVSGRYMFNEKIGLKGQYAYFYFQDKENHLNKSAMHKVTLEAVYNLGNALNFNYAFQERFTLLLHGGAGVSFLKPKESYDYEKIGNLQLGITPMVKISNQVAFYMDVTPVINLMQHYSYGGELLNAEHKAQSGFFLTANAGFVLYLGNRNQHADWY